MRRQSSTESGAKSQRSRTRPSPTLAWAHALRRLGAGGATLGLSVLSAATIPNAARAAALYRWDNRHESQGMLRLVPELYSMSTTENYDPTGAKAAVPGLTSNKRTGLDVWGVYGVSREMSLYARFSMASVSFETTAIPGSAGMQGSGSGLTEQGLGVNYRLWESAPGGRQTTIDGQFQIDIPLYDNVSLRTSTPPQPLRGEGSLDLTAGAFATHPLNQGTGTRIFGIAGLGLAIRSNNYSKAIPWQLQVVGLPEKSGLLWRLGIHGLKSMSSDSTTLPAFSPQAQTGGVLNRADSGGSYIVDTLNPGYMAFRASVGYQWGIGDQIYLTYSSHMSGSSTAAITAIFLGAQFRMAMGQGQSGASESGSSGATAKSKYVYDLDGHVKQANDRLNLVKIDKGANDGINKGDYVDIYRVKSDGTPADLVARGVVTSVAPSEAVVNLRQYKKETWVQRGFIARRIVIRK
jgi:hypothetical protein